MATGSQYYSADYKAQARPKRLAEGGAQEWEEFSGAYSRHASQLFRYFWIHTRSRLTAEDLVSETFLSALDTLPTYRSVRGPLSTWLFGIGRRVLARHFTERARAIAADARALAATATEQVGPPLEERIDLWQAVSGLSISEREVIALKFGAGLAHREIGEIVGLREAHVGVVVYRALQKLRDRLSGGVRTDAR